MMTCNSCSSTLKPLFTGFFCPNDCDRTPEKNLEWLEIHSDGVYKIYITNKPQDFSRFNEFPKYSGWWIPRDMRAEEIITRMGSIGWEVRYSRISYFDTDNLAIIEKL